MKSYMISEETLVAVLNILGRLPYGEVFEVVRKIEMETAMQSEEKKNPAKEGK